MTRLVLDGHEIHLVDVKAGGLRPPRPEELPGLRYLAYGTSITQGMSATGPMLHYPRQVAWRLGADLANFGVAGSAFCEPELADYLASAIPWDFATLCLSVNMYNQGVELRRVPEPRRVHEHRDGAAESREAGALHQRPCRTSADLGAVPADHPGRGPVQAYRDALREVVERSGLPNLHFVSGADLISDVGGLSSDLLHPGDLGMIEIGERLAAHLRPILRAAGLDPR